MPFIPNLKAASTSITRTLGVNKSGPFTFTCVRRPESRLVSEVAWLGKDSVEDFDTILYRALESPKDSEWYAHIRPQAETLKYWRDRLELIIPFEHLQDRWPDVQARFREDKIKIGPLQYHRKTQEKFLWRLRDWRQRDWSDVIDYYREDFDLCPEWLDSFPAVSTIPAATRRALRSSPQ